MRARALLAGLLAVAVWVVLAPPAAAQLVLLPAATRTTSGASAGLAFDLSDVQTAVFFLSVTAAATEAGDTLDVYLQHSPDGGTTWDDFGHFTQVLGNGGAKKFLGRWTRPITPTTPASTAPRDGALTAGTFEQGPISTLWRVRWVIVDVVTNGNQSFTFGVTASVTRLRR